MKRTQIYLDEELFDMLEIESREGHKSISELIRDSIYEKYGYRSIVIKKRLESVFGLWKNRKFDTDKYIRELRKDRLNDSN